MSGPFWRAWRACGCAKQTYLSGSDETVERQKQSPDPVPLSTPRKSRRRLVAAAHAPVVKAARASGIDPNFLFRTPEPGILGRGHGAAVTQVCTTRWTHDNWTACARGFSRRSSRCRCCRAVRSRLDLWLSSGGTGADAKQTRPCCPTTSSLSSSTSRRRLSSGSSVSPSSTTFSITVSDRPSSRSPASAHRVRGDRRDAVVCRAALRLHQRTRADRRRAPAAAAAAAAGCWRRVAQTQARARPVGGAVARSSQTPTFRDAPPGPVAAVPRTSQRTCGYAPRPRAEPRARAASLREARTTSVGGPGRAGQSGGTLQGLSL